MSKKVLIINRGEIALRILRACHELGYKAIVAYSIADKSSLAVRLADETLCIGPGTASKSYLNAQNIIAAAEIAHADFIHPGYGFLSENAEFVEQVEKSGFSLIGPSSAHIRLMGDKVRARQFMQSHDIPTVPGSDGALTDDIELMKKTAQLIGYPVLLKAAGGGGGRGMRVVEKESDLQSAFMTTKQEAKKAFANSAIYMEKFLSEPRHIEIQILSDGIDALSLGARDCSLQRRYQKVIEESLPININRQKIDEIGELCSRLCTKIGYVGAGTFEFLYQDGQFYFIEMNTRIQVEHPVTEMITGIDLLQEQILIADKQPLRIKQSDIKFSGHAIECRLNAEDSVSFLPSPGTIKFYHPPGGPGIRMDTHIYTGYSVPALYDSLLGKLIVHAPTREKALIKMRYALEELVIEGIETNISMHKDLIKKLMSDNTSYDIKTLERHLEQVRAMA